MDRIAKEIETVLRKYPTFRRAPGKYVALEGTFTAHSDDGTIAIDDYEVRITILSSYPYSFPKVEEVSNKIQPRDATRHINVDGTLCLANPVDEARVCRNGITLTWFLENILNPHFCREYVRERDGYYITGERSHRTEGIWESYYEIFGTRDKAYILDELALILSSKHTGRNDPCYCGSGKKYKICHAKVEPKVFDVGRDKLSEFYQLLKKSVQ
jgi:SEC-C motif